MDIIYSHVKEPIRQGELVSSVYDRFLKKLIKQAVMDAQSDDVYILPAKERHEAMENIRSKQTEEQCHAEAIEFVVKLDAASKNLRLAIGLAWDEVRPWALANKKIKAKEAVREPASCSHPGVDE